MKLLTLPSVKPKQRRDDGLFLICCGSLSSLSHPVSCKAKEISSFLDKPWKQWQKSSERGPQYFFMAYPICKNWKNRAEGSKVEWQVWACSLSFYTAPILHRDGSNRHFQTLLDELFWLRQKVQHQKGGAGGNPCYSFTYWDFIPTVKEENWTSAHPELQNGPFCLFKLLGLCLREDPWEQKEEVVDFWCSQEENWKPVPYCSL